MMKTKASLFILMFVMILVSIGCPEPGTIDPPEKIRLYIEYDDTRGSVVCSPEKQQYYTGETVTITASAKEGYIFSSWTGDVSSDEKTLQIELSSNIEIEALFSYENFLWDMSVDSEMWGSLALSRDSDTVYGVTSTKLYALDTHSGILSWEYVHSGGRASAPTIDRQGTIFFGNNDFLYAVDPTGELKWHFDAGDSISSSPAILENGMIVFGCDDGYVYALYPNGDLASKIHLSDNSFTDDPSIDGLGNIFITGQDTKLYWLVLEDESLIKKAGRSLPGGSLSSVSPTVISDTRFLVPNDRYIYEFQAGDVSIDISGGLDVSVNDIFSSNATVSSDGAIFLTSYNMNSSNGTLRCLSDSYSQVWEKVFQNYVFTTPILGNDGNIYLADANPTDGGDGKLYIIDSEDGNELATAELVEPVRTSPVLTDDGIMIIAGKEGSVFALRPTDINGDYADGPDESALWNSAQGNMQNDGNWLELGSYQLLTTEVVGNGRVDTDQRNRLYEAGSAVTVTAVADTSWEFDHWENATGTPSGNENPLMFTIDNDDVTRCAVFVQLDNTLDVTQTGNGHVVVSPDKIEYSIEESITLTATADDDYRFDHWEGPVTGSENPLTFSFAGTSTVTAVFLPREMWKVFLPVGSSSTHAASDGQGNLYVGVYKYEPSFGALYCLDTITGELEWKKEYDSGVYNCPSIAHDTVFVSSGNTVYAYSFGGEEKDSYTVTSETVTSPAVFYDSATDKISVFVGTDNRIYCLDFSDGVFSDVWDKEHTEHNKTSQISINSDCTKIYYTGNTILYEIDATDGSIVDDTQKTIANYFYFTSGEPVLDSILSPNGIYCFDDSHRIYKRVNEGVPLVQVDFTLGEWKSSMCINNSILVAYSKNDDTSLHAYQLSNNQELWASTNLTINGGAVLSSDDKLLVSTNSSVLILNQNDGSLISSFVAGNSSGLSNLLLTDDGVLVGNNTNSWFAYNTGCSGIDENSSWSQYRADPQRTGVQKKNE